MNTLSERLFNTFCDQHGVPISRIPECSEKSPDYRLGPPLGTAFFEIKQIEPNPEERQLLQMDMEQWNPEWVHHWGYPGERVRKKITPAVRQLRRLAEGRAPTMLVLFNTLDIWPELADSDAVKVAMYGTESALISPVAAPEGGATILKRWHGRRRKTTRSDNTSLSAVGVMVLRNDQIELDVFHNYFASCPFPPELLNNRCVHHYRLDGDPNSSFPPWKVVDG